MLSETTIPLGEIAERITVGYVGSMAQEYVEDGIPFLRSLNVKRFKFDPNNIKYVSPEFHEKIKKSVLNPGDVVVVRTGVPGASCVIPDSLEEANCSDLVIIRCGNRLDPDFTSYYINSVTSSHIDGKLVGAIQKHFNIGEAKQLAFPKIDLSHQKKISKVPSTLDAKIKLNNRINTELEAMAKLLYDYWFVQFDFPMTAEQAAELGKPELEGQPYKASGGKMVYNDDLKREIPDGWEVKNLGDEINFDRGISYKSTDIAEDGTPFINLNSFNLDGRYKESGIKYYNGKYNSQKVVIKGDLIIAMTDVTRNSDIIGRSFLVPEISEKDILLSCDLAKVNCSGKITKEWLVMLFNSEYYHDYIKWFASGTLVLHLDLNGVSWFKTEIPPIELSKEYAAVRQKFSLMIENNQKQNKKLTILRDWLLPMLMNGQVTVNE